MAKVFAVAKKKIVINAEAEFDNQKAVTVPEDAVVRWQGKFFVFVKTGGHNFKMVSIELGTASEGYRQIKSSVIDASSAIVIKNAYTLPMAFRNGRE